MTIPPPNIDALKTARHPWREPVFNTVKSEENGRVVVRVVAHFFDGSIDSESRDICSVDEAHTVYIEIEEEAASELTQILKRRNRTKVEKP
jgi:hypothetical protein